MPGRNYTDGTGYRYGFNGKENDPEVTSTSKGTQDYGFRIYNPSLGRFLSVDPLAPDYPELTPYQFASNTPIQAIDLDGLEGTRSTTNPNGTTTTERSSTFVEPLLPDIKPDPKKSEQAFPSPVHEFTGSFKASFSLGFKKLSTKSDVLKTPSDDNSSDSKPNAYGYQTTKQTDNKLDLFVVSTGAKQTTKQKIVTSDVLHPKTGKVLIKDARLTITVTERVEAVTVGPVSVETREVWVQNNYGPKVKEVYQMRLGADLSKGATIKTNGKSKMGAEIGVDLNSGWLNVKN